MDVDNLSDTTLRCRAAISEAVARQQHLSESFSGWQLGYPCLPLLCLQPFFLFNCLNSSAPLPSCKLLIIPAGLAERFPPPPLTPSPLAAGDERLHQFIQQSPYAVVLLRGARYGLVAHGADAAYLQPLHQTPGRKNTGRKENQFCQFVTEQKKRALKREVLQTVATPARQVRHESQF